MDGLIKGASESNGTVVGVKSRLGSSCTGVLGRYTSGVGFNLVGVNSS